jgi:hypothetical protein
MSGSGAEFVGIGDAGELPLELLGRVTPLRIFVLNGSVAKTRDGVCNLLDGVSDGRHGPTIGDPRRRG